ncbi:hypothetical protein ACFYM2_30045 [Streptomyces sp. NPDC006711]|uniref:hypothetical protein n=2 Tax=unclassified Streptomyces TaxID=2593676 RepID=UPI0036A9DCE7
MAGPVHDRLRYRPEHFEADGALRDVCILNAQPESWQRMIEGFSMAPWRVVFRWTFAESPDEGSLLDAGEIWRHLEEDQDESASLSVQVGNIWFTCYFFDPDEIEFTFDPADVEDEKSFTAVRDFVRRLGDTTQQEVIVTMEGTDHAAMPALLIYAPTERTRGDHS